MGRYVPLNVRVHADQERRFKRAIKNRTGTIVRFTSVNPSQKNGILCLTRQQFLKVQKAPIGTPFQFTFSAAQINANLQHKGGFLPLLLAVLAPILGGVVGGLAEKAIGGSGIREGTNIFWKKKKHTLKLTAHGKGLYLSPHTNHISGQYGTGLFLAPPSHQHQGFGVLKKITSRTQLPDGHPLHNFPISIFM